VRLAEIIDALALRYDPSWAESWDAVGLVCGDPSAEIRRVHFAIDPVEEVAEEAIAGGAQLLVTHHPLYLGGTTSVAATSPKGRVAHRLIGAGVGLYVAHTNADVANPGVNDALAAAIGLRETEVLSPLRSEPSEPSERTGVPSGIGLGRIGQLAAATTLAAFIQAVAEVLPKTAWGVRGAGDPRRPIRTVAVCGGSGGDLAATAAAMGADALVTSDLKHHSTSEAVAELGIALVDAAHWATEAPWLDQAAALLADDLKSVGTTVETAVSRIVTDPWTTHSHADPSEDS
jgi:dinuclear metal center YbgI/SA1388 family protein